MRTALAVLVALTLPAAAQPIDMGDVISFSSAGVSETVTMVSRTETDVYKIHSRAMAANASEYCARYEQLDPTSNRGRACIRKHTASTDTQFVMNCRSNTLTMQSGYGAGAYRPGDDGDPWVSTADPNLIIRADGVYEKVCGAAQPR